jgi:hypothetical protein
VYRLNEDKYLASTGSNAPETTFPILLDGGKSRASAGRGVDCVGTGSRTQE